MPTTATVKQRQSTNPIGALSLPRVAKSEDRDVNGFCSAHVASLKQSLADIKAGRNLVYHDLIENADA